MFQEDPALYLADFGRPCVFGPSTFQGLLDQPDDMKQVFEVRERSREYDLRYLTTAAALTRGQVGTVSGVSYRIREAPRQLDDGVFSVVALEKV